MLLRTTRRFFLALALSLAVPQMVRATDTEYRDFKILVDGKDSGYSQMTITREKDGSMTMTAQAAVRIRQVVFTYSFTTQSSEWWKDGQLVNLKTTSTEQGKQTVVTATAQGNQIVLTVNGKQSLVRPDIWPTSFWKLPDARYHNKEIPVLESDTGKEYLGRLQYIATEEMTIGNEKQRCYHFRVTGIPSPADVWFDRYYLLVRQDFVDSGHRTSVQLLNVRR